MPQAHAKAAVSRVLNGGSTSSDINMLEESPVSENNDNGFVYSAPVSQGGGSQDNVGQGLVNSSIEEHGDDQDDIDDTNIKIVDSNHKEVKGLATGLTKEE